MAPVAALFGGHRFVFLTRAPTPNFKAVLTRYGGVFSVATEGGATATAAMADPTALALADPALIDQVDPALLRCYAGRIYRPALITDSVRRAAIQPIERYLIVPSATAVAADATAPAAAAAAAAGAPAAASTPVASVLSGAVAPVPSSSSPATADSDDEVVELPPATATAAAAAAASKKSRAAAAPQPVAAASAHGSTRRPVASIVASETDVSVVAASPAPSGHSAPDFAVPTLPASPSGAGKRRRSGTAAVRSDAAHTAISEDNASVGSKRTRRSSGGGDSLPALERPTPPSPATPAPRDARSPAPASRAPASASSRASASTPTRAGPSAALVNAMVQEHRRRSLDKQLADASPARSATPSARPATASPSRAAAVAPLEPDVRVAETPEEEEEDETMQDSSAAPLQPPQAHALSDDDRASAIASAVGFLESEGFSRPLIIHALLVTSGSMKHARAYLHRTLPAQVHCWSAEEDHIIGGHDTRQTQMLVQRLGVEAVKTRTRFLCSHEMEDQQPAP